MGSEITSQTASGGASTTTSNSTVVTRGSPSPTTTRSTTPRFARGSAPASRPRVRCPRAVRSGSPSRHPTRAGERPRPARPPDHRPHHRPGAPPRRQVDLQGDRRSATRLGEGERLRGCDRVHPPPSIVHRTGSTTGPSRVPARGASPLSPSRPGSARAARQRGRPRERPEALGALDRVAPRTPGARHAAGLEDRRALEPDLGEHAPRWRPGERHPVGVHRVAGEAGVLLREAQPASASTGPLASERPTCSASSRSKVVTVPVNAAERSRADQPGDPADPVATRAP